MSDGRGLEVDVFGPLVGAHHGVGVDGRDPINNCLYKRAAGAAFTSAPQALP